MRPSPPSAGPGPAAVPSSPPVVGTRSLPIGSRSPPRPVQPTTGQGEVTAGSVRPTGGLYEITPGLVRPTTDRVEITAGPDQPTGGRVEITPGPVRTAGRGNLGHFSRRPTRRRQKSTRRWKKFERRRKKGAKPRPPNPFLSWTGVSERLRCTRRSSTRTGIRRKARRPAPRFGSHRSRGRRPPSSHPILPKRPSPPLPIGVRPRLAATRRRTPNSRFGGDLRQVEASPVASRSPSNQPGRIQTPGSRLKSSSNVQTGSP